MSESLRPCPACGASVRLVGGNEWHDRNHFVIRCEESGCGCVRIGDTEREECVRRWNALPRAPHITPNDADCAGCPERRSQGLVWTENPPTVPGWYWIRAKKGGKYVVFEVVSEGDQLDVDMAGASFSIEALIVEWSGPIPIPEEPVS